MTRVRVGGHALVRAMTERLLERAYNAAMARAAALNAEVVQMERMRAGENLEVLDPPTLPESPMSPNRSGFAAIGLAGGLLFGYRSSRGMARRNRRAG